VAGRGRTRWWVAVAFVAVIAAALWAVAGARVLLAHHRAAGGMPADSTTAAGARAGKGGGTAEDSSAVLSPHLLGSLPVKASVVAMAFTPDGKTLVVRLGTGIVQLLDAATGAVRSSVEPGGQSSPQPAGSLAVSPDGTVIAIGVNPDTGANSAVDLISLAAGKVTATIPVGSPMVYSLAFSPDGKTLAIGAGKSLLLLNLATRESVSVSTEEGSFTGDSRYVSFSADGKSLAVANDLGLVKLWDVLATGFAKSTTVYSTQGTPWPVIQAATISPDGGTVAVSGALEDNGGPHASETWLWHPSTGHVRPLQPTTLQDGVSDDIQAQAFSPDGKLIATGDDIGEIRLWDTATGRLIATEHAPSTIFPVTATAFVPDGKSLATAQSSFSSPQGSTATIQLWGLDPATAQSNGQLSATGNGRVWGSSPAGTASLALAALRPGIYQVARVSGVEGSWVLTLDSVQVAESGKATFVLTSENTSTSEGQLSCAGSPNTSAASITLATGRVINSVAAYCPDYPGQASINVPSQGSLKSDTVFASSRGLGQPFTFDWSGLGGLSLTQSGITLSR
jgi:WD40 repeat protein